MIKFCTSGGSGIGNSDEILKACCASTVRWIPGKRLSRGATKESLKEWIAGLGL